MGKFVLLKDAKTGEPIYPISALPSEFTDEEIEEICDFEEGMNEDDVIPKATKDLLGCVVVGDGLDVDANGVLSNARGMDLLWQNASPRSEFTAQTISLDLSGYDGVLFLTLWQNTFSGGFNSQYVPVGESSVLFVSYYLNVHRSVAVRTTGITFDVGALVNPYGSVGTGRNDLAIPYKIYGIKGVS